MPAVNISSFELNVSKYIEPQVTGIGNEDLKVAVYGGTTGNLCAQKEEVEGCCKLRPASAMQ